MNNKMFLYWHLSDVQVSSFYLLETSLSLSDIQQYATSCSHNTSVSLINQDDIELQTDARLVIPSKCDGKIYSSQVYDQTNQTEFAVY